MEKTRHTAESVGDFSEIMTVHDLAVYLKMSDAKIYRMARAGTLPVIRIGKTWRFKRELVDSWLRQHVTADLESI